MSTIYIIDSMMVNILFLLRLGGKAGAFTARALYLFRYGNRNNVVVG